jgi:hypothetical protein
MPDNRRPLSRARIGGLAVSALLLAGFTLALGAQAASSQVAVSPLTIINGTANGSISGLAANSEVNVDGHTQQTDQNGRVTLNGAPLDGDGVLTLGFTDPNGKPQTVKVDLSDAVTGLPLTPGQIGDPLANTTRGVNFSTGDSSSGGGGSTGGTGGGNSAGSTPAGAVATPTGISIPASSVVVGQARLAIAAVKFNPTTVRSREADPRPARREGHARVSRP